MHKLKRVVASVAVAGTLVVGGVATAAPAQATYPVPGIDGCYMFSWWDYMYLFHGVSGYCLSDHGPIYFDDQGNYG